MKKQLMTIAALGLLGTPAAGITAQRVTSIADNGPGTLRAAITAAGAEDTITFAPWLYGKQILLNSEISISKKLLIKGDIDGDNRPDITLDGQRKTRMLKITSSGDLTLWGMELEHGTADQGGAIYNAGRLSINHSILTKNAAREGGAIYSQKYLAIDKTSLTKNTASKKGGAIYVKPPGRFAFANPPTTRIYKSTLAWNWARDKGGALYNLGHLTIQTSTLSYNRAQKSETETTMENRGSALWTYISGSGIKYRTAVYDSTLIGNDSHPVTRTQQPGDTGTQIVSIKKFNGGTIYTATLDRRATLELKRTVIAESVGRNCGGWGNISTENIWSDDKSCASSGDRGDPKIRHLADNGGYTLTHMPKKDSGLLSAAGHNCKDTDQRGAQRKNADGETGTDTQCDIGAVERGHTPPGRQTPHPIDRRVPEEYNEDISVLKRNISTLQTQKEALQEQIAAKDARIAELEAPDELQVTMGDAGKINRLTLNDDSALKEWETLVKIGDGNNNESGILANTTTHHIRGITGGSKISDGKFEGENGLIHWRATSTVMPRTNVHVTRYEIWSTAAFGEVAFGLYADIDLYPDTSRNWLAVGGRGHPNRLLVTNGNDHPTSGVAIGVRWLRNASRIGWMGNPERYTPNGGRVLDASTLTGADAGWGTFTPDQELYPGATGYGPADIALTVGIRLKPSATLASFEIVVLGAPNGEIPSN